MIENWEVAMGYPRPMDPVLIRGMWRVGFTLHTQFALSIDLSWSRDFQSKRINLPSLTQTLKVRRTLNNSVV